MSKPFKNQVNIGDWVMYNNELYDWLINTYPELPDYKKAQYKTETSKKYKIYDIGIFKRNGLVQLHLQELYHTDSDLYFVLTVYSDGTPAEYLWNKFSGQFLVKVENETT